MHKWKQFHFQLAQMREEEVVFGVFFPSETSLKSQHGEGKWEWNRQFALELQS